MSDPLARPKTTENPIQRVAILFSGGPAPAANSVIGAAAIAFTRGGTEVIGIRHGYSSLQEYDGNTPLEEGKDYVILGELPGESTYNSGNYHWHCPSKPGEGDFQARTPKRR